MIQKKYKKSIFRFRQDLRTFDNIGLFESIKNSSQILPIFIFDTTILSKFIPQDKRIGFLVSAIQKLKNQLQELGLDLFVFYGNSQEIIPKLLSEHKIDALFNNKSYGSGSLHRDKFIEHYCKNNDVYFCQYPDFLLVEPEEVEQRKVFTPFFKLWQIKLNQKTIEYKIIQKGETQLIKVENDISKVLSLLSYAESTRDVDFSLDRLDTFNYTNYTETRNIPSIDGSSRLSPYIRFGLISIRQLYMKAKEKTLVYVSELAWREFWQHIAYYFPETKLIEFQERKRTIEWSKDDAFLKAWQEGKTGYPIVDAGMRQLRQENWMHNRVRMIVASFLTKDLLIDRRLGEQEFAKYLLDYDENVNIGNRQRSASVGADPKPIRIFSPILQSQRFDPDALYIKKYIPELKDTPPSMIHDPIKFKLPYVVPIVNHAFQVKKAKEMYYKNMYN